MSSRHVAGDSMDVHTRPIYSDTPGVQMRTTVEIDDKLMARAMKATKSKTKKETIAKALEMVVRQNGQKRMLKYMGKVDWKGDLDAWRRD
jgi:Arc/MetJ family transcription regulator